MKRLKFLTIFLLFPVSLFAQDWLQSWVSGAGGSAAVTETTTKYTITKDTVEIAGHLVVTTIEFTTFTATSAIFQDSDDDTVKIQPSNLYPIWYGDGATRLFGVDSTGDIWVPTGKGLLSDGAAFRIGNQSTMLTMLGENMGVDTYAPLGKFHIEDADTILFDFGVDSYHPTNADDADTASIRFEADASGDPKIAFFGSDGTSWNIEMDGSVDKQLLFTTTATSASAITDPMFEILVGTTPTADQQIFGVSKGTQASNTSLFSVDEDGDVSASSRFVAGTRFQIGTTALLNGLLRTDTSQEITIDSNTEGAGGINLGVAGDADLLQVEAITTFNTTVNFAADGQADDDYEIALAGISALTTGLTVTFTATTANTDGATLEITSVGDLDAILKMHDQALVTGDIEAGQVVVVVFDGTNWQMTSRIAQ